MNGKADSREQDVAAFEAEARAQRCVSAAVAFLALKENIDE